MEPDNVSYYAGKDPAASQMEVYKQTHPNQQTQQITTAEGRPLGSITNVLTIGPRGPMTLTDTTFLEELAHFNRERIPERVVHAKGAGAFGYFEVTSPEITKYCSAALFNQVGKKTPVAVRFSTDIGERGSADTVRDLRGFAVKFHTEEGNWDLAGLNTPIFFVRDPLPFFSFIRSQKRNPVTNLFDFNTRWDYFTMRPESLHQLTYMYGDRGIPDGYRHMDAYGSNTFKLVNSSGEAVYNKFYFQTGQGIKNLDAAKANQLTVTDPDYAVHDLYNAIERKEYPFWTMYIQVMTFEQARTWEFNPFDVTKVWPLSEFPLIEVGRLTLNRNPINFFSEVEQLVFCPGNRVRGIEFSPDKVLQSRVLAYSDAARYRIGVNFSLIPVNQPVVPVLSPTIRDGVMMTGSNQGAMPNYYPSSFNPSARDNPERNNEVRHHVETTDIDRFVSDNEDNFTQPRELFLSYPPDERRRLCANLANDLRFVHGYIQERALDHFEKIHPEYAEGVRRALKEAKRAGQ